MGSSGASQGSGSRVLPGKKMAGNMGGQQVTVQNLRVLKVDAANGIVVVNGEFLIALQIALPLLINYRMCRWSQGCPRQDPRRFEEAMACGFYSSGCRCGR